MKSASLDPDKFLDNPGPADRLQDLEDLHTALCLLRDCSRLRRSWLKTVAMWAVRRELKRKPRRRNT